VRPTIGCIDVLPGDDSEVVDTYGSRVQSAGWIDGLKGTVQSPQKAVEHSRCIAIRANDASLIVQT
jgi:hypothetical protein